MSEPVMIVLMTLGPLLWCIGGTFWKPARRFIWPIIAGITLVGLTTWWVWLGVVLTMIASACLPYGDRTPWWLKVLVFASLGAHVIWLDWLFGLGWAVGTAVILSAYMALSHRFPRVTHKVFEGLAGFLQATGLILGVLR